MPRGGKRPGAGRPIGAKTVNRKAKRPTQKPKPETASPKLETAMEYLKRVMNDPATAQARRDKIALRLLPYELPKRSAAEAAPPGKKAVRQGVAEAASAKGSRFAVPPPPGPRLAISNSDK